jgi:hypothetical protein
MGKISPPVPINTTVSLISDSEIASNRMFRPVTGAEMQGMAFAGIQLRGEFADIIGHSSSVSRKQGKPRKTEVSPLPKAKIGTKRETSA